MRTIIIALGFAALAACSTANTADEKARHQANELNALRSSNRYAQDAIDKANARIKLLESKLSATEAELKSTQNLLASAREKCGDACRR